MLVVQIFVVEWAKSNQGSLSSTITTTNLIRAIYFDCCSLLLFLISTLNCFFYMFGSWNKSLKTQDIRSGRAIRPTHPTSSYCSAVISTRCSILAWSSFWTIHGYRPTILISRKWDTKCVCKRSHLSRRRATSTRTRSDCRRRIRQT